MHLGRPCSPHQTRQLRRSRAAHDGIIDQNHPLSFDHFPDGIQFEPYHACSLLLGRSDKGPGDILVFDKADPVGDPGCVRITDRRVQARVRHADDHVRIDGMGLCQAPSRLLPPSADGASLQDRIRPGEINILKDTQGARHLPAVRANRADSLRACGDDLSREDIPHKAGSDRIQGTALRSENDCSVRLFSYAERPETMRIPGRQQLGGRHQDQGVSTLYAAHGALQGLFDRGGGQALLCDQVRNHLRVACRVENAAGQFQFLPQLYGIDQISIVTDRQISLAMPDHNGLGVGPARVAAGRIAHVTCSDIAFSKRLQGQSGEDLADQSDVFVKMKNPLAGDGDPGRLLSSVLQGKEPCISVISHAAVFRLPNPEHTAFFMNQFLFPPLRKTPAGAPGTYHNKASGRYARCRRPAGSVPFLPCLPPLWHSLHTQPGKPHRVPAERA